MAFTTWSTTDLVNVTLSGGNLIATASAASAGVRGKDPKRSGKYYIEYTLPASQNASNLFGLASRRATLGAAPSQAIATAQYNLGTLVFYDVFGVQVTTGINLGNLTGSVLCCAIDLDARLVWFRLGAAGNWNANAAYNPATGAGGVSVVAVGLGQGIDVYPFAYLGSSTNSITANFGASAFTGSVPSGYTSGWDDSVAVETSVVATQVGTETWASNPNPAMQLTQVGTEIWVPANAFTQAQLTQLAAEQWLDANPSAQLTQIVLEHWGPAGTSQPQAVLTQMALEMWAASPAAAAVQSRAWIMA